MKDINPYLNGKHGASNLVDLDPYTDSFENGIPSLMALYQDTGNGVKKRKSYAWSLVETKGPPTC